MRVKAKVSTAVKLVCGKEWAKEVADLIEKTISILEATGRKYGERDSFVQFPVVVTVNKKGVTVTTQSSFRADLEECELQVKA